MAMQWLRHRNKGVLCLLGEEKAMSDKILIASDSFKGSATSLEVGQALAKGIRMVLPNADIKVFAVADGGEGTVEAFAENSSGRQRQVEVLSPDGQKILAHYFISQDGHFAVLEVAEATGLTKVTSSASDILQLSSFGTGQLIRDALDQGVSEIFLGLGGSATNDMGLGIASALGVRFLDKAGTPLPPLPVHFKEIEAFDLTGLDKRLSTVSITLLADVSNPLCGPQGASYIFGPQKGASSETIVFLDDALSEVADKIERDYGINLKALPFGGAAGGMGAGLSFFLGASIQPGIETLLTLAHFSEALKEADLVITGEGRLDDQSLAGKVPIGVANLARQHQVPAIALVGSSSDNLSAVYEAGLTAVFPIVSGPMSLELAMERTLDLLTYTSQNLMRFYQALKKKDKGKQVDEEPMS